MVGTAFKLIMGLVRVLEIFFVREVKVRFFFFFFWGFSFRLGSW